MDKTLGYPKNFKYFIPGTYTGVLKGVTNNLHDFYAFWDNEKDGLGYKIQLQSKGTYHARKNVFDITSSTVTTDYVDIEMIDMDAKKWHKDEVYIDTGKDSPVYLNACQKIGYNILLSSFTQVENVARVRYVKYDENDNVIAYGDWVRSTTNKDGSVAVVVDEKDNPTETTDYATGVEQTDNDFKETENVDFDVVGSTQSYFNQLGQLPMLMAKLFLFIPKELIELIGMSISLMMLVSLVKAVRG